MLVRVWHLRLGLSLRVRDAFDNAVYNSSVALAITPAHNPGSTSLHGTTTHTTGSTGVAVFNALTIQIVGIGYELRASDSPGPERR